MQARPCESGVKPPHLQIFVVRLSQYGRKAEKLEGPFRTGILSNTVSTHTIHIHALILRHTNLPTCLILEHIQQTKALILEHVVANI
jgi:hypothetical protein